MKTRIIQTRFWQDSFIAELPIEAKLLFLYCITNERLELTGAYEIPKKYIAIETGLAIGQVEKGFNEINSKVVYIDGYVVIKNHRKFQDYSKGSENQQAAFGRELENLPKSVKAILGGTIGLVGNQLASSSLLDINKKEEIRNKKTESIENNIEVRNNTFLNFQRNETEILESAKKLYPDKNVNKAMEDFKGWCETSKTSNNTKDYKLRFYRWVREDKFNQYTQQKSDLERAAEATRVNLPNFNK